ncbi:pyridoxamine 5'-phosphate oxidase family protein [Conyzicola sp.]|uniref:pyridoxamine 5'-phosphate oxidase family protein n=1 Tax=Conyzicola sp. TaxID=1969404 RepID=UPI003989FA51
MTDDTDLETIRTIIDAAKVAILTTTSEEGELHSRPLAVLSDTFEGSLWFFTADPSPKSRDIAANPEVNVAYADNKAYLSIAGTASIDRDRTRIDQLWNPMVEAWFENGKDDPSVALLRVDARSAEYWSIDKPGVVRAFEIAKALVTKTPPDLGENRTVAL